MEVEKAGECYEPQLKRLARNVLRQRYTDGVIDEMLAPDRVTYEDLARAAADTSSPEPPSILKTIFHDTSRKRCPARRLARERRAGCDDRVEGGHARAREAGSLAARARAAWRCGSFEAARDHLALCPRRRVPKRSPLRAATERRGRPRSEDEGRRGGRSRARAAASPELRECVCRHGGPRREGAGASQRLHRGRLAGVDRHVPVRGACAPLVLRRADCREEVRRGARRHHRTREQLLVGPRCHAESPVGSVPSHGRTR